MVMVQLLLLKNGDGNGNGSTSVDGYHLLVFEYAVNVTHVFSK